MEIKDNWIEGKGGYVRSNHVCSYWRSCRNPSEEVGMRSSNVPTTMEF